MAVMFFCCLFFFHFKLLTFLFIQLHGFKLFLSLSIPAPCITSKQTLVITYPTTGQPRYFAPRSSLGSRIPAL